MRNLISIALLACLIFSSCTKDSGNLVVHYTKSQAISGDIDEVRNTPLLEASKALEDPGKIYLGEDILLIGEEGNGIHIYNNSNPANPQSVAYMNIPFCREFFVDGNYIYAESQYDFLKINISNSQQPFIEERIENAFAQTLQDGEGNDIVGFFYEDVTETIKINSDEATMLETSDVLFFDARNTLIPPSAVPSSFAGTSSGLSGTINRVTSHNEFVYVASANKIHIFSNNGSFDKISEIQTWDFIETLYPQGDYMFAGARSSMQIYDVRNPQNPFQESSHWHTTSCDPVLPNGNVAYITLRTGDFSDCPGDVNALEVVSISNISSPDLRQQLPMESPYGMTLVDDVLYVGNGENGLAMFDASNPLDLTQIGTDNSVKAYDVIPHPTIPDLILTSGPNGIEQYEYNSETLEFNLIGYIYIPA